MKKLQRIFTLAVIVVSTAVCAALVGCGDKDGSKGAQEKEDDGLLSGEYNVEIDVKDYGVIKAVLDADEAPVTVTNFVKLVKEGFYDGLTFQRIISGFVIQGGDPSVVGRTDSAETIKGEFSANGVENNISHTRGVLSMARNSFDMDSASGQFFIVHKDSTYLDGSYAAFGHVTEGMEVVDAICDKVVPVDDNGTVPFEDQPVITSIKLVE